MSSGAAGVHIIEVYQDSGGDLDVLKVAQYSPIVMQSFFAGREAAS